MSPEDRLYTDLRKLAISYQVFEHSPVFTVEESQAIKAEIVCLHTKNLFLKDAAGAFFLLTVPAAARIDLKNVPARIGSKRLSFGKPDDMQRLIGVTPGSVTPLAMINAEADSIALVLDSGLTGHEPVGVHPLRNTATLTLAGDEILRLAEVWGHQPAVVNLPKVNA